LQLLLVTGILMIPQLTLQILNIALPVMRATPTKRPTVPFVFGILLTAFPFFLALILNTSQGSRTPPIFREYDKIKSSILIALTVLVVTIPSMLMLPAATDVPNLTAFLQTASLLGLALPLFYYIAFVKFISIRTRSSDKINSKDALLRRNSSDSASNQRNDDADKLNAAEEAMTMAKMLEHMGRYDAAEDAFTRTLSLFKLQGEYSIQGGFTQKEIQSFGVKSLEVVVQALVTMAKMIATHRSQEIDFDLSAKPVLDALSIYESASVRKHLKDRNFIFPVLSYICVIAQGGKIKFPEGQSQADYLLGVAIKFISETEYQCFHHCRALALKAVSLAQQLRFDDAVIVIKDMNRIYDPVKHGRVIAEEYGSDHCCNVVALSTLWLKHLGREQEATIICDDIIERCLPEIDETNILGRILVLMPTIAVLRSSGQVERTVELYTQFVAEPVKGFGKKWSSPAKSIIRPLALLLKVCSQSEAYNELDEDIEWLLNEEEKIPDWTDSIYTSMVQWSSYSLCAEICLRVAKKLGKDDPRRALLIREGLRLSRLADPKLKNDSGDVIHPIAFGMHNVVMSELEEL
jgi:tetratricopeptide (TPR) repeat protein